MVYNIPLLYGTVGEIMVEKSGSLNLGVEGIMAVGAIFGYIVGCYANSLAVGILTAFLMGALCGLLFAALTVSLQANQNITGLTLTTFGLGVYFFVGNGLKAVKWPAMNDYSHIKQGFANIAIPGLSKLPVVGEGLFHHNLLVYLGVVIAVAMWWYLNRTTPGLRLRAVGENPGAADSVGVNVKRCKYIHICIGCGMCAKACPYGAPQLDTVAKKMTKCDACQDRLAKGLNPVCVDSCPQRAIEFGDMSELLKKHSDRKHIAPLPDPSVTKPNLLVKAPRNAKPVGDKSGTVFGADR